MWSHFRQALNLIFYIKNGVKSQTLKLLACKRIKEKTTLNHNSSDYDSIHRTYENEDNGGY